MCLDSFFESINYLISKSRAFHNVGAAYRKDRSKNELAHLLLIVGTHNKQGSKDARVRIVVPLTLKLITSHNYSGAVLLTGRAYQIVCQDARDNQLDVPATSNCIGKDRRATESL